MAVCEAAPPGPYHLRVLPAERFERDAAEFIVSDRPDGFDAWDSGTMPEGLARFIIVTRDALPHWVARAVEAEAILRRLLASYGDPEDVYKVYLAAKGHLEGGTDA